MTDQLNAARAAQIAKNIDDGTTGADVRATVWRLLAEQRLGKEEAHREAREVFAEVKAEAETQEVLSANAEGLTIFPEDHGVDDSAAESGDGELSLFGSDHTGGDDA